MKTKQLVTLLAIGGALVCLFPEAAFAATQGGNPWEQNFGKLIESLTGPMAKMIAFLLLVVTGFAISMDVGAGAKKLLQAAFGILIAFNAGAVATNLFGLQIGALF